jgi:5'-phosphate synthase pdxT subunit
VKRIGVLALQGGFDPHLRALKTLGVEATPVKTLEEIRKQDALVIPGGESTTIGKLLGLLSLFDPLRELLTQGFPVFGTCAGLILLSRMAVGRDQPLLGVLNVDVSRNAYGRQTESFETVLPFDDGSQTLEVPAVFIRAPQIVRTGHNVKILSTYEGRPVCVRQGRILAAAFHPELTDSPVLHDYFLSLF